MGQSCLRFQQKRRALCGISDLSCVRKRFPLERRPDESDASSQARATTKPSQWQPRRVGQYFINTPASTSPFQLFKNHLAMRFQEHLCHSCAHVGSLEPLSVKMLPKTQQDIHAEQACSPCVSCRVFAMFVDRERKGVVGIWLIAKAAFPSP